MGSGRAAVPGRPHGERERVPAPGLRDLRAQDRAGNPRLRGVQPVDQPGMSRWSSRRAYRLGHSMLNETILRKNAGTISLFDGFLNPLAFSGTVQRQWRQWPHRSSEHRRGCGYAAQQRDRRVRHRASATTSSAPRSTSPAINIARGRDLGVPSLNNTRYQLWLQTARRTVPVRLGTPCTAGARHQESFVNFLAAYAKWPTITAAATTVAAKRRSKQPHHWSQQLDPARRGRRGVPCRHGQLISPAASSTANIRGP